MTLVKYKFLKENIYFSLIACFVIVLGLYFGFFLYKYIHEEELRSLEIRAKTIAAFINPENVKNLSGSEEDVYNPLYKNLKEKLMEVRSFYPDTRFVYLIAEKEGVIYFVVDSEDPNSEDYSPPGQEYPEASVGVVAALQNGEVVLEGPVSDRWGSWISSLVPLKDASGEVVAIVGMDIDATSHTSHLYTSLFFVIASTLILLILFFVIFRTRRKEQEIVELKSEFTSLASHELRSPLTFIRWKVGTLLETANLPEGATRILGEVKEAILRLVTMSNSILETTAVDYKASNKKDFKEVELLPVVSNAIKAVEGGRTQKEISIVFDEKLFKEAKVLGEADKIELVFINLLSNAIKYSKEKSSIDLSLEEEKENILIKIKDQGVGIPPEDIKYIFSGFYRAKNVKNSGIRGSGFGLYMTRKIVEFMGGVIKCNSTVGEGTTFIIKFLKA